VKLFYIANIRLPTEKAHGLQIMQNCEAFAANGAAVTLYVARRRNTPEMQAVAAKTDVWTHYGVARNFQIASIASIDLYGPLERVLGPVPFWLQQVTFTLFAVLTLLFQRADVYYSRDMFTLLVLSLIKPRRRLIYEAHTLSKSRIGGMVQRLCARRVGVVVAVTGTLAARLREGGARRAIVEHDGFRIDRFVGLPTRPAARSALNLPAEAFIVGYVGRLHTMSMSKGVDVLIEAIAAAERPISLCLVGGPDEMAEALRRQWERVGLPPEHFLFVGQVPPARVPLYIAAFDVCAMPFPFTEHFAYYASPLKLFEYMAVGGAIVASDLPAVAEVVRHGESALLTPPDDVPALRDALRAVYDDAELRDRLGAAAKQAAGHYAWSARASRILAVIREEVGK